VKVHGVEIPKHVIDDCQKYLLGDKRDGFSLGNLAAFINRRVPDACADRVADRILQKLKKDGKITYDGRVWRALKP
jgi:hypothetical protein